MDELQIALAELQSPNPDIRELALDKIGTLNPEHAFEIITPFLSDPDPEIRGTAACNLGEIGDPQSIPLLIDLARQDVVEKVRAEALASLENYKTPEVLRCLVDEVCRTKKSRRPRQIVARQLGNYDDFESLEALGILLLQDDDVYVRIFAADSLLKFNRLDLQNIWEQALQDESSYVVAIANQALSTLRNAGVFPQAG